MSTSPHVGSLRKSVLGSTQKGGADCRFARIAAPETCDSEIASGRRSTGEPLLVTVPMQECIKQLRQNPHQTCHVRERSPSRRHSSKNPKSLGSFRVSFSEAKFRKCRESSLSSAVSCTHRLCTAASAKLICPAAPCRSTLFLCRAGSRDSRLQRQPERTRDTRRNPFLHVPRRDASGTKARCLALNSSCR